MDWAQPIDPDLTAKLLGRGVAVSPVVTVEPRRRKFHKAITLSMPAPRAHSQGMINQYSGSAPTLRLLCSITGGTTRAQWEDVTGSTPLTFVNDCVSFTTTVSARFWLMDCRNIADATKMATELYKEAIHVPFMAKFVVFAKRTDPLEARLRVFCMTDDREDKTLEHQEHFTEVAKSRDVEVLEDKSQYIELAGNLVPITKSGEQLSLPFKAFRENRLPFSVRVKDQHADIVGRTLFMREPKIAKGEPPQQPICILNIVLPETIIPDQVTTIEDSQEVVVRLGHSTRVSPRDQNYLGELRVVDISNLLGEDWVKLAPEIGVNETDVDNIIAQNPTSSAQQAQAMLKLFQSKARNDFNILENGLRTIQRDDIVDRCLRTTATSTSTTTTVTMRNKTAFSISKRSHDINIIAEQDSIAKLVQKDDQFTKEEYNKYSAEEKQVDESEESEEDTIKKTVAERRKQIEKRLSADRSIPASTQKKEIVEEIITIKRASVIDDTRAKHEEEILMQKPIDNSYKSSVIPEPVVKLKTSTVKEGGAAIAKDEFDRELQDKFKSTLKNVDDFEHKSQLLTGETVDNSAKIVDEIAKKDAPEPSRKPDDDKKKPDSEDESPIPKERIPVPSKRTSITREDATDQGVVIESIKNVHEKISSFESKSSAESSKRTSWAKDSTSSKQLSEEQDFPTHQTHLDKLQEQLTEKKTLPDWTEQDEILAQKRDFEEMEKETEKWTEEKEIMAQKQQFDQLEEHFLQQQQKVMSDTQEKWTEEQEIQAQKAQFEQMEKSEQIFQERKSEVISKVEEKMSSQTKSFAETIKTDTGLGDAYRQEIQEFAAQSSQTKTTVDQKVDKTVTEMRDSEVVSETKESSQQSKEAYDKLAEAFAKETVTSSHEPTPKIQEAFTKESFESIREETVSKDRSGTLKETAQKTKTEIETGVRQGEDILAEKIFEVGEEFRRTEETPAVKPDEQPSIVETITKTVTQEVTSKIPVFSKRPSPDEPAKPKVVPKQPTVEDLEVTTKQTDAPTSKIPRFDSSKPAGVKMDTVHIKSPEADTKQTKIPIFKDRKVSEQISSDSGDTVITQKTVREQDSLLKSDSDERPIETYTAALVESGEITSKEVKEVLSFTTIDESILNELITEDERAVTPDDFIDEIIIEAHDTVQQMQQAEISAYTLDLSRSEDDVLEKSPHPIPEYVTERYELEEDDREHEKWQDSTKEPANINELRKSHSELQNNDRGLWEQNDHNFFSRFAKVLHSQSLADDAHSLVPDDASTTDLEAFRDYHWLDTPDSGTGITVANPAIAQKQPKGTQAKQSVLRQGVVLASTEDFDTESLQSSDVGDDRKKPAVQDADEITTKTYKTRKEFNLDLDTDATAPRKTERKTRFETHLNQGTSPMTDIVESPDSVHHYSARGESPAIKLVIGRKEIKTSDTSAITESRLTVYGHKDVEISISSQSTISLTTTTTSKDGREVSSEFVSSGTGAKESTTTTKRYKQFKLIDEDQDSERVERKRDDTVSFSKKKSVYLFGSFDSSSESPITEASGSGHVTDTGISLTRGFTETMTSPGIVSSTEEKNKKISIVTDTAVDVEIEELELTDAGLSPILPDETDVTADFQMAEEDVQYAHMGTSPVDFEEQSVSAALDTSEAATLTDRIETKDASNSPLDTNITSILKRDLTKITDEELLIGRRGSGDVKAKIKILEQNQKIQSAQSSPKKKVEFEDYQVRATEIHESPKKQKVASAKISELKKIFGEEQEPEESNIMSDSIPPIQEVIKQLEKRIAVEQIDRRVIDQIDASAIRTLPPPATKKETLEVHELADLEAQIIPDETIKAIKAPAPLDSTEEVKLTKLVRGVQQLGLQEQHKRQLTEELQEAETKALLDEPVCEKIICKKYVPGLTEDALEELEPKRTNDLIKMFESKHTQDLETTPHSPKITKIQQDEKTRAIMSAVEVEKTIHSRTTVTTRDEIRSERQIIEIEELESETQAVGKLFIKTQIHKEPEEIIQPEDESEQYEEKLKQGEICKLNQNLISMFDKTITVGKYAQQDKQTKQETKAQISHSMKEPKLEQKSPEEVQQSVANIKARFNQMSGEDQLLKQKQYIPNPSIKKQVYATEKIHKKPEPAETQTDEEIDPLAAGEKLATKQTEAVAGIGEKNKEDGIQLEQKPHPPIDKPKYAEVEKSISLVPDETEKIEEAKKIVTKTKLDEKQLEAKPVSPVEETKPAEGKPVSPIDEAKPAEVEKAVSSVADKTKEIEEVEEIVTETKLDEKQPEGKPVSPVDEAKPAEAKPVSPVAEAMPAEVEETVSPVADETKEIEEVEEILIDTKHDVKQLEAKSVSPVDEAKPAGVEKAISPVADETKKIEEVEEIVTETKLDEKQFEAKPVSPVDDAKPAEVEKTVSQVPGETKEIEEVEEIVTETKLDVKQLEAKPVSPVDDAKPAER
ncbi:ankyrin-2-like [Wyeomyia smithii]|uniref:ankyrin-2-like n=1 Tax=Wyeomyia smithii TaxID=174621 RepID=UPI0024681A5A|nr:ankyrin-2-like [Wyeomyia smithii]